MTAFMTTFMVMKEAINLNQMNLTIVNYLSSRLIKW